MKTENEIKKQAFWITLLSIPLALIGMVWAAAVVLVLIVFISMPLWLPVVLLIGIFN